jgi:histone deacetylase 11
MTDLLDSVDVDAHQGNGHERCHMGDNDVFILDAFNPFIYPGDEFAKKAISCSVHVNPGDDDARYMAKLREFVPRSIDSFMPQMIILNAGTDVLQGDPLGHLSITSEGIIERDEFIFQCAFERGIPIVMVLSGGYQLTNAEIIAQSIRNLDHKFHLKDGCIQNNDKTI